MAENTIEKVRVAETSAEDVLRKATQDAAKIVDEAYVKAVEIKNHAEDEANKNASQQIAAAHKQSQQVLEKAMGELEASTDEIAEKAREKQVQAAMTLLRNIA